jgi:antirestriction protein ArdC
MLLYSWRWHRIQINILSQNLNAMDSTTKPRDVFALVTNRIIEHLEHGTVPWKQPWAERGLPRNLFTGKTYRGINVWLLNALNYEENAFLTFNQVKELGGNVRRGEKSHLVVLWKWIDDNSTNITENGATGRQIPYLRYYQVFNVSQCSDIPEEYLPLIVPTNNDPIGICEAIVETMPHVPEIRHMGDEAYYHPFFDLVNMPPMHRFINSETYYSTLFHELIHATGHKDRLNRKEIDAAMVPDKIGKYSLEELTAEIGACYLNSYAGIDGWDFQNHIAYLQGWLERLRNDKRLIVYACAQAQLAADYILNLRRDNWQENTNEREILQTIEI